jgi:hypothetical protein
MTLVSAVTETQLLTVISILAMGAIPTLFWLLIKEKDARRKDATETLTHVLAFETVLRERNAIATRMVKHTETLIKVVTRLESRPEGD